MSRNRLQMTIEIALFAALAFIIDVLLPSLSPAFKITFKMLPIILVSLRWGVIAGLSSGFVWGLLQVVTGEASILSAYQAAIEYFLAFTAIGLAGLFHKPVQKALRSSKTNWVKLTICSILSIIVGSLFRYLFHLYAGVIFWGQYAPEGQSAFMYSLITNGSAFLSEGITCIFVFIIILPFANQILLNKKSCVE